MTALPDISDRLDAVRKRIGAAAHRAGRDPDSVRLLAVSKTHDPQAIRQAYAAGQRWFGENYVQEMADKASQLADLDDLRFRFVGHLQRNKVKDVVRVGATLDTLDSLRLADAIVRRLEPGAQLEVLIEVNVGEEAQKAGVLPVDVPALCCQVRERSGLSLRGLLVIPPASADPERTRPYFRAARKLADACRLPELSMGMSGDFEVAIEEGATMVRLGTAVFGPRMPRSTEP